MRFRLALLAAAFLATTVSSAWAEGPVVKHDKLEITVLIEQSISVLYTNRGGNQAFDIATGDIVSFRSGADTAWLLPVLNGNADTHPLQSGQCDVLIYKADTDYLTLVQFSHVPFGETREDQCVGVKHPLVIRLDQAASPLVVYPTIYGSKRKTTTWRVLAYDALNRSFCFAPRASLSLTTVANTTHMNEANAGDVIKHLNLPADAFKCIAPTKFD
ncbi:hypothetical protein ACFQ3P_41275 [Paraburkholderia sabiae]|uniref:Secreted protein n=1 Tax=Paraburkholderia sabiae TaxID=273251 RepID=A0ABU9QRD4_9BURK|nr:hypothetical protein [Paraburkholderia sabiae]WJZ79349.1 hypothetical protein QEN71_41705 [Paraburkholderia sabiae]CAD6563019.1 hypothetical protein LMG24235_08261 [Paraburkholderia sabiae]